MGVILLKLKRQTFKYIEREIYDLHDTIKEIKVIEYDIMHGNNTDTDKIGRAHV